ncbi:flagellar hook-length control protein FliK [Allosphingosinicella vermicomposti]|uniref:flagellar hook-length control protein FliK n=1 Tax=Allosphingosinicella vermicomposti TaxID=614671 RepID=UPI000D0FA344|nr:flagellar hook-length control protein FliK [Allosphingosinicella vermicomposti]
MTLHSTIKIAGATPERAGDGSAVAAEGDLFTQLLSTLVVPPPAELGAAAPGELLFLPPEALASDGEAEDVSTVSPSTDDDEADAEDQILALAVLFTPPPVERPVAAPAMTSAPAVEASVSTQSPMADGAPTPILADVTQPSGEQKVDDAPADFQLPLPKAEIGGEQSLVKNEEASLPGKATVVVPAPAAKPIADPGHIASALAPAVPAARPAKSVSLERALPAATPVMPRTDTQGFQPLVFDIAPALSEAAPDAVAAFESAMPAEFAVEQQLNLSRDEQWLDQLAKDIAQTGGKDGQLRFRLNPETLGTLRVEVSQGQAGASIRLSADTEAARTIVADAQPRLVAEAKAQGVRIAETHVDLGTGQGPAGDPRRDAQGRNDQDFIRAAARADETNETPEPARKAGPSERYA